MGEMNTDIWAAWTTVRKFKLFVCFLWMVKALHKKSVITCDNTRPC